MLRRAAEIFGPPDFWKDFNEGYLVSKQRLLLDVFFIFCTFIVVSRLDFGFPEKIILLSLNILICALSSSLRLRL